MKLNLILLTIFVSSAFAGITIKEFEDEFNELWSDPADEAAAADELAKEEASIEQHNLDYENGKSSYSEKLNELSALPMDEFESEMLGAIETPENATGLIETPEEERTISAEDQEYLDNIYEDMDRQSIPSSYDARSLWLITKPNNQMSCGSCAAFAATATHETCMRRAGTPLKGLDLSEQQLVDCGYNKKSMNGCNGAYVGAYQDWLASSKKAVSHEAQYPYLDRDPNLRCMGKPTWNTGAKITRAITDYRCNEDKLKKLVYKYGAVATGIYASDSAFGNYAKGVFDTCSSTKMNHAVTVVGYGTENGKPYWVVKNSWGANWGDGGFIKIARGNSECGIGSQCALVECTKTGTASPAPQAPPPAPIPASQICDISNLYGTTGITGQYTLTTTINGKQYVANVKCTNSKCSPAAAGPSNACMYICGKIEC
jgi:C1A family cysteine protease